MFFIDYKSSKIAYKTEHKSRRDSFLKLLALQQVRTRIYII